MSYSVLMSVYAKEKPEFLRESMMSMYEQTVPTDDFVLICDGPLNEELDTVIDEMSRLFGGRLRVFRLLKNHGLGYALKFGVEKCKNELIARMDSDDVSVKDRCEKELRVFEREDVDVVGSNILEYDEKMEKIFGVRKVPMLNTEIKKYARRRNPINHQTVMYKKSKVLSVGNYEILNGFEDYYLWAKMIQQRNIFYNIQTALVNVRGGVEMCNRRGGLRYLKDTIRFQKDLRRNKIISIPRAIINVSERFIVALVPNFIRSVIYMRFLRGRA